MVTETLFNDAAYKLFNIENVTNCYNLSAS